MSRRPPFSDSPSPSQEHRQPAAPRPSAGVALLLLAIAAGGCSYSSPYMRPSQAGYPMAPADAAQVVFVRPSAMGFALGVTLLDGSGRFLGDLPAESHFAVAVPPGQHLFFAWAENTAAIRADLAPGRTYFVEVSPRPGFLSMRIQLLALTPRHPKWRERGAWIRETQHLIADRTAGQAEMNRRAEDRAERLRRAREILRKYDPTELAERTLTPDDGV